jgi:alpha-tubulin suppressor-like RCC1 family protein
MRNTRGQLGFGDCTNRYVFTKLENNFGTIKYIHYGVEYNIISNDKNELFVCGANCHGQLGLGNKEDHRVHIKLDHNFLTIKKICCGGFHNTILNDKNELYASGCNYCGQIGIYHG